MKMKRLKQNHQTTVVMSAAIARRPLRAFAVQSVKAPIIEELSSLLATADTMSAWAIFSATDH